MKYLLDTDTVSFAICGEGRVAARILDHSPRTLAVSSISIAELRFGAHKRGSQKLFDLIDAFLAPIHEIPFDSEAADHFGRLAAELRRAGTQIGDFDTMIAAHALALDVILVTHNLRHFRHVPGLQFEDWYV